MKLRYFILIPAATFVLSLVLFAFELFLVRYNLLSRASVETYDKSVSILGMLSVAAFIIGSIIASIIFVARKIKKKA